MSTIERLRIHCITRLQTNTLTITLNATRFNKGKGVYTIGKFWGCSATAERRTIAAHFAQAEIPLIRHIVENHSTKFPTHRYQTPLDEISSSEDINRHCLRGASISA